MSEAMKLLKKKPKKTTADAELDAPVKAKKKSKTEKSEKVKTKKKKAAPAEAAVEEVAEVAVPSIKKIKEMKSKALEKVHATLPEALDGWAELDNKQKRKALIEALHDEVPAEKTKKKKKAKDEEAEPEVPKKKRTVKADSTNVIEAAVYEVTNLSEEEVDQAIADLMESGDMNDFKLGGILAVIDENKYYGEYESFRDKIEGDFEGLGYRKARYLIENYNNIVDSNVPFKKLEKVGWTKLKEISSVINEDNADEWIEKALSMNTVSLQEEVREYLSGGKSPSKAKSSKSEVSTLSYKVHQDQKDNVEAAIDKALQEAGTDAKAVALEHMALEYLAGGQKKPPTLRQLFSTLKAKHGEDSEAAYEEMRKAWNKEFTDIEIAKLQ